MARTKNKTIHQRQQQQTPHHLPTTSAPAPAATVTVDSLSSLDCESLASVISLLAASTSQSLQFLNSSDLALLPSQALSLSSLLHSSALSLSTLLSVLGPTTPIPNPNPNPNPNYHGNLNPNNNNSNIPPPPHQQQQQQQQKFSWFRRFLTTTSSCPSDPRWLENFRMSKPSFYLLLQTLTPALVSLSTSPIPPDHKLAAALFRLAHAAPFAFVARRFGLSSPALACCALYEVCKAVSDSLGHLFELSSDTARILQGFNWISLPNCCGALSFLRFPLQGGDLFGGSLTAQCLVDSEGRFLDVSVGWLGFMKAQEILLKTKLFTQSSSVLSTNGKNNSSAPPRYFIGGRCCPLLPWLLTPYKKRGGGGGGGGGGGSQSEEEEVFNTVHARGMELAERAFRRLRARWRILKMEWKEECAEALPYVVVATCLLHNYLIKCSEPFVEEEEEESGGGGKVEVGFADFDGEDDEAGESTRGMLALHLSQVIYK